MTEGEWLACEVPQELLNFVEKRANARKLRLFAVACCRRISEGFSSAGLQAVEIAERLADGNATAAELASAHGRLSSVRLCYPFNGWDHVARAASSPGADFAANSAGTEARFAARPDRGTAEYAAHCHLVRCIFGNPFHAAFLHAKWLTWNEQTVTRLAQTIYEERRFEMLRVLADALEDAGCTEPLILDHCRGPSGHARGCWVVDLLLSKS
jgi:hypothetical protein